MTALKDLKLFTTNLHNCSYLADKKARTLFVDPELGIEPILHSQLSALGFRRSGDHLYRPYCDNCSQCIPCRVLVDDFIPNKRFKRVLNKNNDLKIEPIDSIAEDEYFQLYDHYIQTRHQDGDMYPATYEQYESFLIKGVDCSLFFKMTFEENLVGVMICDQLENALSAVFTFYDSAHAKRSLGTFAVLWQIAEARRLGLPYVYLGYWIKECAKMSYKTQFRPMEVFIEQQWIRLN